MPCRSAAQACSQEAPSGIGTALAADTSNAVARFYLALADNQAGEPRKAIGAWLGEHVHRHGRRLDTEALVERVTGGPIDAGPFLRYASTA